MAATYTNTPKEIADKIAKISKSFPVEPPVNSEESAYCICVNCYAAVNVKIKDFPYDIKELWTCKSCGFKVNHRKRKSTEDIKLTRLYKERSRIDKKISHILNRRAAKADEIIQKWMRELPKPNYVVDVPNKCITAQGRVK